MVHYDNQTIVYAVVGMVGIASSIAILTYAFRRNRTGTGRYQ
jgi:uncharacterized membrane protein YuzA (DUF378 family)